MSPLPGRTASDRAASAPRDAPLSGAPRDAPLPAPPRCAASGAPAMRRFPAPPAMPPAASVSVRAGTSRWTTWPDGTQFMTSKESGERCRRVSV
jgi:hypothetical protein